MKASTAWRVIAKELLTKPARPRGLCGLCGKVYRLFGEGRISLETRDAMLSQLTAHVNEARLEGQVLYGYLVFDDDVKWPWHQPEARALFALFLAHEAQ